MERSATKLTGSPDNEVWISELPGLDGDFLLLYGFYGLMENSGSFVDSVLSWLEHKDRISQALVKFGIPEDAPLVERSIELGLRLQEEDSAGAEEERDQIDEISCLSDTRIMESVVANHSKFMVDVRDYL